MKRMMAAALAALMISLPVTAVAQPPQGPYGRPDRHDRERDRERPPARETSWPGREGHGQRGESMSPQEREQLRRDINSHGRDIYRQERGRR